MQHIKLEFTGVLYYNNETISVERHRYDYRDKEIFYGIAFMHAHDHTAANGICR